jgi:subtilase family serine protease
MQNTQLKLSHPMKYLFQSLVIFVLFGHGTVMQAQTSPAVTASTSAVSGILSRVTKVKGLKLVSAASLQAPASDSCLATFGIPCYSPQQIQNAYGVSSLLQAGYNGAGQTIVIIDSFGSPTIASDLATFDAAYGLPDPPSFSVLSPLGTVPFDPTNALMVNWAFETTLDVQWAHAMAPGANIVLLTSPVAETEGVQGMPEFLALEKYAVKHHLGKIISQSWGATENTLFDAAGQKVIDDFEDFYKRAGEEKVTILASAGDDGSSNVDASGNTYPFPTVLFPASSPRVTSVGGTSLYADETGKYQYEIVWDDHYIGGGGGGVSQQFTEPPYQYSLPSSVQATLNNHRGIPDVSYNADPNTAILVYSSFLGPAGASFYFIGGTSEGAPQWAGIVADANQLAGHPLGFLNRKIYAIGECLGFFHDITFGSNAFNGFNGVPGFIASPGWDLATGWGTPDIGALAAELAKDE